MLVTCMSAAWQKRHLLSRTRVCDRTEVDLRLQGRSLPSRADPRLISEDIVGIVGRVLRRRGRVGDKCLLMHTQGRAVLCYAMQCRAVQRSAVSATQHSAVPCQYPGPSQPCATAPRTAMRHAPAPTVPAGSARHIGRAWRDREGNGRSLGRATSRVSSDI